MIWTEGVLPTRQHRSYITSASFSLLIKVEIPQIIEFFLYRSVKLVIPLIPKIYTIRLWNKPFLKLRRISFT